MCGGSSSRDEAQSKICEVTAVSATAALRSTDGGTTFSVAWSDLTAYTPEPEAVSPDGEMRVVYQDDSVIVVEKPAFLTTENTLRVKDSVRARVEALLSAAGVEVDVRIPHRLDWETSGLMVVAVGATAMRSLAKQFADRQITKCYVADVVGAPPALSGTVRLPLGNDPCRRPRQMVDFDAGKPASTSWEVLERQPHACRLRLTPESGRRHQLRMHCLALGCQIAGDGLYTPSRREGEGGGGEGDGGGDEGDEGKGGGGEGGGGEGEGGGGAAAAAAASGVREGSGAAAARAPPAAPTPTRLHLHATELGFTHPISGQRLLFHSAPPFMLPVPYTLYPAPPFMLPVPCTLYPAPPFMLPRRCALIRDASPTSLECDASPASLECDASPASLECDALPASLECDALPASPAECDASPAECEIATCPLHVAPMVDVTDRHFRMFVRCISPTPVLWTEMVCGPIGYRVHAASRQPLCCGPRWYVGP